MRLVRALVAAVFATWVAGAQAETWRHEPTGINIDIPAELRLGEVRDPNSDGTDVSVQLGSDRTIVTFFVYRAAYPNVALWYDRARRALNASLGIGGTAVPRRFTLAGASGPNGLREELDVPPGQRIRATGVALAGYGEWLVKVRISSADLDREGLARLMDGVLAGIRPGRTAARNLPLTLPDSCPEALTFSGSELRSDSGVATAAAAGLQTLEASVRGGAGLAVEPEAWCRMETALPPHIISVFRRRDGDGWVALLGDAGAAMTAMYPGGGTEGPAAVYGSNTSGNRLLYLYDEIPAPAPEVERGINATLSIRVTAA